VKEVGVVGECIAAEALRQRGFRVFKPGEFVRALELAAVYHSLEGQCAAEPPRPLAYTLATPYGYVKVGYWRGRCLEGLPDATPLEASAYAPCVKRCIEAELGPLLQALSRHIHLLAYRRALATVDLFAEKDGEIYAVEVKTNTGRLTEAQREKAEALELKHLLVRVHIQNPIVEIRPL